MAETIDRARLRVGIDTGGTFTDIVAVDEVTGRIATTKTPSTPNDPSVGFMDGIAKVLDQMGATLSDVTVVSHGTTVATNALLEDDFGGLGFVTTEGFRHVLEIARQSVPEGYGNSYFWVKPDRIVPLHLVREVPGRLDAEGNEARPPDDDATAAAARWFKVRGIDAVGICFINAYVDPRHERRARDVFAREHPDCAVSISSDVLREYREYERSVTTLVDAFVKPKVARYVTGIQDRLGAVAGGKPPPFYVMKSNGGVASADEVGAAPITTILSGPAAGVLGSAFLGAEGAENVLTLDGGGTSTDVSVIRSGRPTLTTEGSVGRFPVKVPMIDVVTVGTGGGSIAHLAPDGALRVGPRSAGADPGPMCYLRGGTEPATTDAHLLLGRIPPHLLGGEIPLDAAAAREGIERLAGSLDMGLEECGAGVLEIAAWNQANAIRQVTVKRGLDVRDFTMIAFGGSGPLLACRLLDILGLDAAVVPRDPGNLSALGLLTVDVKNDYVRTFVRPDSAISVTEIAALVDELRAQAAGALKREGFDEAVRTFAVSADLRYRGQAFEVRVPAPPGRIDEGWVEAVRAAFHDEHERFYGYCYRSDPRHEVEWVNLRVAGIGPIERPAPPAVEEGSGDAGRAATGERRVYFDGAWHEATLYDRNALSRGDRIEGPAVIEEFGSTLPIHPGLTGEVAAKGSIIIRRPQ